MRLERLDYIIMTGVFLSNTAFEYFALHTGLPFAVFLGFLGVFIYLTLQFLSYLCSR